MFRWGMVSHGFSLCDTDEGRIALRTLGFVVVVRPFRRGVYDSMIDCFRSGCKAAEIIQVA